MSYESLYWVLVYKADNWKMILVILNESEVRLHQHNTTQITMGEECKHCKNWFSVLKREKYFNSR